MTSLSTTAQVKISGTITDRTGVPLPGVNVYLEGTYDGTSTTGDGAFAFTTEKTGNQALVASFIGFKTHRGEITIGENDIHPEIILKESANALDAVVISAGSFEASDEKKSVIFKPLDIVTTGGALADIPSAINTLPGTQLVGEEGKLFVRGGESYETRTYMDGMIVDKPYETTMPDVPSRGRFSPFMFKGTIFSSGGYSAENGQALSSALILQTNDLPTETVTGLSFMSIGGGASHTQKWDDKTSLSVSADYFDIGPYFKLIDQDLDWQDAPRGVGSSLSFRQKTGKDGLIKVFAQGGASRSSLNYPTDIDLKTTRNINLTDDNLYANATYRDLHGKKFISNGGIAYTWNSDQMIMPGSRFGETINNMQARYNLTWLPAEEIKIKAGGDLWSRNYHHKYTVDSIFDHFENRFTDNIFSGFVETEVRLSKKFAARAGIRSEYTSLTNQSNLAPRISLAYKVGEKGQVSFAWGQFYQSPLNEYLVFDQYLDFEKATHYILNYQVMKNKRTFRLEAYYKTYDNLVKYGQLYNTDPSSYTNSGDGYARGIDLFWRDNSMGNIDYWVSYSYIDTERNYKNYPVAATPEFVSDHNLALVYKHYIPAISSQAGITYRLASGRPYYNPENPEFLSDRTKPYNDLSFNISYLTHLWDNFTIVYFSVSNLLGWDQVFNYRYSLNPDSQGNYTVMPVKPGAKRFLFLGIFISI